MERVGRHCMKREGGMKRSRRSDVAKGDVTREVVWGQSRDPLR